MGSDAIATNGVTIDESAQFSLTDLSNSSLPIGTVFTVLSNTSTAAITGTFGNLADGAVFTVGSNAYQANYEGGDRKDLMTWPRKCRSVAQDSFGFDS